MGRLKVFRSPKVRTGSDHEALHKASQVTDIGIANHPNLEMSFNYAAAETMYARDEGAWIVTNLSPESNMDN